MSMLRRAGVAVPALAFHNRGRGFRAGADRQGVWSKAAPMTGVRSELRAVMAGGKPEDKRQPNLL